jgi:hypothetical protein
MVYVIQVCWQLASKIRILLASCQQTYMTYTIAVRTLKTPDDGHRNCPKHVDFYSKNKFEKLVHLVWFIIRIYHDAWSHERQAPALLPSEWTIRCVYWMEQQWHLNHSITQHVYKFSKQLVLAVLISHCQTFSYHESPVKYIFAKVSLTVQFW